MQLNKHNRLVGEWGEQMAADYLRKKGYSILHTNWRAGRSEIDIIASLQKVLHFVEVKTRVRVSGLSPELRVNENKIRQLRLGAQAFLEANPEWKFIQFDIIAIQPDQKGGHEIFFVGDIS